MRLVFKQLMKSNQNKKNKFVHSLQEYINTNAPWACSVGHHVGKQKKLN